MSYAALHPVISATVKRRSITTDSHGRRRAGTPTSVGTVSGGYEDLSASDQVSMSGNNRKLEGRLYLDKAQDLPVLRGDTLTFTDVATSETLTLQVEDRRGPFTEHFELDLASEQEGGAAGRVS